MMQVKLMKYPIGFGLILLSALPIATVSLAQGISSEGVSEDGVTAEGATYNGTGTVQDSAADGDIKVIDVLDSDAKVKAEEEKPDKGSKKAK
jgi:hypothetical protein